MGGGALGLVGLDVAILAGRLFPPVPACLASGGFWYPRMSSLLVTFGTAESGDVTGSFLAEPRHGSLENFEVFCFSAAASGSEGSFSFSIRPGGLTGGGGAGLLVETGLLLLRAVTGTRLDLGSISFCRIGAEISRFLRLLLSGFAFLGSELSLAALSPSLPTSFSATLGVLFTPEISLVRPEVSGLVLLFSRWQRVAWVATGAGWMVDQVGVTVVVLASSLVVEVVEVLEVVEVGWWMIGGILGEVGEGRVSLSLNTARLALSLPGSFSLLRMED